MAAALQKTLTSSTDPQMMRPLGASPIIIQVEMDTANMQAAHDIMEANGFRQVQIFATDSHLSNAMDIVFENQASRCPNALTSINGLLMLLFSHDRIILIHHH